MRYAVLFLFLLLCPVLSWAAIQISEITPINFGMIQIPAAGTETFTINGSTGSASGIGTSLNNIQTRGQYTITNTDHVNDVTVTIDVENNGGGGVLQMNNFTGQFGSTTINRFPVSSLLLRKGQSLTLYLGATISYNQNVSDGTTYNPAYNIMVNIP